MIKSYKLVKTDLHVNMSQTGDRVVFYAPELDLQFIRWGGEFVQTDTSKDWDKTTETKYTVDWEVPEEKPEVENEVPNIDFGW